MLQVWSSLGPPPVSRERLLSTLILVYAVFHLAQPTPHIHILPTPTPSRPHAHALHPRPHPSLFVPLYPCTSVPQATSYNARLALGPERSQPLCLLRKEGPSSQKAVYPAREGTWGFLDPALSKYSVCHSCPLTYISVHASSCLTFATTPTSHLSTLPTNIHHHHHLHLSIYLSISLPLYFSFSAPTCQKL